LGPADSKEIFQILTNLPNKYSSGLDGVPINILKAVTEYISDPFADLVCLLDNFQPNFQKLLPISLLSAFSKVFEKAIYSRIVHFFDAHSILSETQFGWSTWTCMTTILL